MKMVMMMELEEMMLEVEESGNEGKCWGWVGTHVSS